jgi:hypothetical protein
MLNCDDVFADHSANNSLDLTSQQRDVDLDGGDKVDLRTAWARD